MTADQEASMACRIADLELRVIELEAQIRYLCSAWTASLNEIEHEVRAGRQIIGLALDQARPRE